MTHTKRRKKNQLKHILVLLTKAHTRTHTLPISRRGRRRDVVFDVNIHVFDRSMIVRPKRRNIQNKKTDKVSSGGAQFDVVSFFSCIFPLSWIYHNILFRSICFGCFGENKGVSTAHNIYLQQSAREQHNFEIHFPPKIKVKSKVKLKTIENHKQRCARWIKSH